MKINANLMMDLVPMPQEANTASQSGNGEEKFSSVLNKAMATDERKPVEKNEREASRNNDRKEAENQNSAKVESETSKTDSHAPEEAEKETPNTAKTTEAEKNTETSKNDATQENSVGSESSPGESVKVTDAQLQTVAAIEVPVIPVALPEKTVSMKELIEQMNLTAEQTEGIAKKLGVSTEELKNIKVSLQETGKTPAETATTRMDAIKAIMPDGTEKDLLAALNLKEEIKSASGGEITQKLADALGIDQQQAEKMLDSLKVSTVNVKSETGGENSRQSFEAGRHIFQEKEKTVKGEKKADTIFAEKPENPDTDISEHIADNESKESILSAAKNEKSSPVFHMDNSIKAGNASVATEDNGFKIAESSSATSKVKPAAETAHPSYAREAATSDRTLETKVMSQIAEKVKLISLPNSTEAKLKLTPPSLGSVEVKIVMQDSHAKAVIGVESHFVKHVVEQNLDQLKNSLQQQGITVDEMSVSVNQNNHGSADSGMSQDGNGDGRFAKSLFGNESIEKEANSFIDHERIRRSFRNRTVDLTA